MTATGPLKPCCRLAKKDADDFYDWAQDEESDEQKEWWRIKEQIARAHLKYCAATEGK